MARTRSMVPGGSRSTREIAERRAYIEIVVVDRRDQVSSLDTFGKFVLDIRFFSSIIYILYEGGSLRPPVVTRSYDGLK